MTNKLDRMLPKKNPTSTSAWKELESHFTKINNISLNELFEKDSDRFNKFSVKHEGLLIDFSKNHLIEETIGLLVNLANEVDLSFAIKAMFSGEKINETEGRSVLHTALREPPGLNSTKNSPIGKSINEVLEKMEIFSERVIQGQWKGYSGRSIEHIVNIGIGGSDLGPAMAYEALTPYNTQNIKVHFVSNVDSSHLVETLKMVNPETTLFIISSKTFTTQETMTNAYSVREWFLKQAKKDDIPNHFVAVSTNLTATKEFGIHDENVFEFWDWVGGRYSVWSAIGLSLACGLGFQNFRNFLEGAASMDIHFQETKFEENIPVILAMVSIWYINFYNCGGEAILPYNQYLDKLVDYLQQVVMESNGKNVDRNGNKVNYTTSPIIWGSPGTNSQHSFFQMLHQGTQLIPCDFVAAMKSPHSLGDHNQKLLANFFAQSRALMTGKSLEEVEKELAQQGCSESEVKSLGPHKVFEGNRPSNSILFDELNPYNLGMLLAMYEHKVFVQGIIWNIFSFDQWGVELGKKIANQILPVVKDEKKSSFDSSTDALISFYKTVSQK